MSYEDLRRRIREFSVQNPPEQQATRANEPQQPLGLMLGQIADPVQAKIDKVLSEPPPEIVVIDKFKNLPEITEKLEKVNRNFDDDKFLNEPALMLDRLSDEQVATLGRGVIPMISSGFSQQGVGAIFILAYHLKDPSDGEYILETDETTVTFDDKSYEDLSPIVMTTRRVHESLEDIGNIPLEAQSYSFLAASMLRMFTKSEENYTKAFSHIIAGYARFYGHNFPVATPQPTEEALRTLSHYFTHGTIFKMTLYRLLYIGGGTKKASGMRKFLYEIHLANTGLHILSIFTRLCGALHCLPEVLLSTLSCKEFELQLNCLISLINLIVDDGGKHARKMWRYGRLFDETFMSPLQTKACPTLVYILAAALKGEAAQSNRDILNIAQLADVGQERKRRCIAAAENLVREIRKHHSQATGSAASKAKKSLELREPELYE